MGAVLEHTAGPGDAGAGRFIVPCPVCGDDGYAAQASDVLSMDFAMDMCVLCSGSHKVSRISAERYQRTKGQRT